MKKLIFLILLLPLFSNSQQVYLGCTKSMVLKDMQVYEEFIKTVHAKNYFEYQKDSIAVGYRFSRGVCTSSLITMSKEEAKKFLKERILKKAWEPYLHGWLYDSKSFDTPIFIRKFDDHYTTTFEYTFPDEEELLELLNVEQDD